MIGFPSVLRREIRVPLCRQIRASPASRRETVAFRSRRHSEESLLTNNFSHLLTAFAILSPSLLI